MSYRDELQASQAQNRALRAQLAEKERELTALRVPEAHSTLPPAPIVPPQRAPSRAHINVVSARTYAPLAIMWLAGIRRSANLVGALSIAPGHSDLVIGWLGRQVARPLLALVRLLLRAALLLVVLPVSALNMLIHTIVLAPWIALSTLRFSDRIVNQERVGWIHGSASSDETEFYFLMTWAIPPLCFPALWLIVALVPSP